MAEKRYLLVSISELGMQISGDEQLLSSAVHSSHSTSLIKPFGYERSDLKHWLSDTLTC